MKYSIQYIDDYAKIIFEKGCVLIDSEDVSMLSNINWYISVHGYLAGFYKGKHYYFHRLIMKAERSKYVDHINKDKLDNRKKNLRIVRNDENIRNSKVSSNNKSGIVGVYWDEERKKWHSQIMVDRKAIFLGRYEDIKDAIIARLKAEKIYFKEFSPQIHLFSLYDI